VQRRWALVATWGDAVLLGQRREDLRYGGLWEPPSKDRSDERGDEDGAPQTEARDAAATLAALAGVAVQRVRRAGDITHILSHRRLEVAVLRAELVCALPSGGEGAAEARGGEAVGGEAVGGEYERFELVDAAGRGARGLSALARKILGVRVTDE
jgi:adenine-specific DNA glycosylase